MALLPEHRPPRVEAPEANVARTPRENPLEVFALAPEQQHTVALLERLLGRAIANRYVDFSQLAASATGLRVSRPLAAHALRELESMIRASLVVPMDANAAFDEQDAKRSEKASEILKEIGYDDKAIERARKDLAPRLNHATQIKLIAQRLGLSADSDIAVAWVSLCSTSGRAHERHFHRNLAVDDEFRDKFQKPLDLVLRGILTALQKHYAALLQRVGAIAAMTNHAQAARLFEDEIPGALPLQWHFYQSITSPQWLPHLLKRNLVTEPLAASGETGVREFGEWPVGHYLLKLAKSGDTSVDECVVEAIHRVAESNHPDVRRQGLEIIAALPPDVSNKLVDVAIGWFDPDTPNFYYTAPEALLKRLAESGHVDGALTLGNALFQVFDQGGTLASLHPQHMYEHHLPEAVKALAGKDGTAAVRLFSGLLVDAANITRKTLDLDEEDRDYTYSTPHPLSESEMAQYGIYEALVIAVRDAALIACQNSPSSTSEVVAYLNSCRLKIFQRVVLHVLSRHAGAAKDVAATLLCDARLIGQNWCEDEYAELALAHYTSLPAGDQQRILATIDALPDRFRSTWVENFIAHNKAAPTAEDERRYNLEVRRGAMWKWRYALSPERKRELDDSVSELGNPEAWHERLFPPEVSPLTGADFSSTPMPDILAFLRSWRPSDEPVRQTIAALGQQLRTAVEQAPSRFADAADQFVDVRPIYGRRLLEGVDTKVRNNERLLWGHLLELIGSVIARLRQPANAFPAADGDDEDWLWCCSTAASLLKSGLRRGAEGIPFEYSSQLENIILTLFELAPRRPSAKDFEDLFRRHSYFAAEQSLWGSSIELCVLFVFWTSKHEASSVAKDQRSALRLLPNITNALETALLDATEWGRIPHAILGRYLKWLSYFGDAWLTSHMAALFPENNDSLRRAAWLGHLINETGPIQSLMPQLGKSYLDEINRLGTDDATDDHEVRGNRLGDYLVILYISNVVPAGMMEHFWQRAPARLRQHVMGFLGRELQSPPSKLPDEYRERAMTYWDIRLSAGIASADPDNYRAELGAIGQWFIHDAVNIDPDWLLDQLLRMLEAGFAPNNAYSLVEWLGKRAASRSDKTVEVLSELLNNAHVSRSTFMTHQASIRSILENGLHADNPGTVQRTQDTISVFATIGEFGYLDLVRPAAVAE